MASRRGAEELIAAGRVTVNGQVATLGDKADLGRDAVKVDGKRLTLPSGHRYVLLNKPAGYVTTRSDPQGRPTVYDLLPRAWRRRLFPVGRLDMDSEGLLLFTDDGDFAHRVAHPAGGCVKTYAVKVKGRPSAETLTRLRAGVDVGGRPTAPARIRPLPAPGRTRPTASTWWQVEIGEGRTRQIREMFFRAGHPVAKLRRVAIGRVSDPGLRRGSYRELAPAEVRALARAGERRAAGGGR